jgi:hypothetical protein
MALATERGGAGDPQAESRAAIAVVAFYVNGKGLTAIVPSAKDWPQPVAKTVTLNGRTDSPQHFTESAALAAHAGGPLSDAIGLYREVDDSRRGSGFSKRRGRPRRRSSARSLRIIGRERAHLATTRIGMRGESDLMPEVAICPSTCPKPSSSVASAVSGAPAYQRMMQDIERRVAACPLYR